MLRFSRQARNFFPLGLSSGPKNRDLFARRNNFDGAATVKSLEISKGNEKRPGYVSRNELKLHCECCRFEWVFDTLTVQCVAHPKVHNQREIWLQPTWMHCRQQPYQYYKFLTLSKNPRTEMLMARETSKGMNTERRAMGLTSPTRRMQKEKRGIARQISNIGIYSTRWQTRFPFPS